MNEGEEYKADDISDSIGLKNSRTRELLNLLIEKNIIEALGENKNRRYRKV